MNERVDDVRRKLDVDVCSLYLAHPDRQTLEIVATSGLHRSVIGKQLGYAQGLTGKVARTRRPVPAPPRAAAGRRKRQCGREEVQ